MRPERRAAALLSGIGLAAVSALVALFAADALVRVAGLDFQPIRARPSHDTVLERAEFRTRVVTNRLGFREARLPGPKPPGVARIVVLGDSFAQGYGVEEPEAFPRRLEALLAARAPARRWEVVNLGVPGACPLDYEVHLRDVGLAYEPDVVVVAIMANDANDIRSLREFGGRIVPSVLQKEQRRLTDGRPVWKRAASRVWPSLYPWVWRQLRGRSGATAHAAERDGADVSEAAPPPMPKDRWREVLVAVAARYGIDGDEAEARVERLTATDRERVVRALTGAYRYDRDVDQEPIWRLMSVLRPRAFADMVLLPPVYDDAWAELERLLGSMHRLSGSAGARLLLTFVPAPYQVTGAAWEPLEERGFEPDVRTLTDTTFLDRLRRFGAARDVEVVDLLTPLRERADPGLYFPLDKHWTPAGHEFAAERLAAAVLGS